MGIREWAAKLVGGRDVVEALDWAQVTEAVNPFLAMGGGLDPDEHQMRRIGSQNAPRNVPRHLREQSLENAIYLYHSNPLAYWMVEQLTAYIAGDKPVLVRASDDQVQRVLDRFTADPVNQWGTLPEELCRWLSVFGEQAYKLFVDVDDQGKPINGRVRIGYIEPAQIEAVRLNADNALITDAIELKGKPGADPVVIPHAKWVDGEDLRQGGCLYFGINKPPNASRGMSDLLASLDWIDGLDKFMVASLDRVQIQNMMAWIVTMKGGSAKKLEEYLRTIPPPKPGQILGTTDRVKWEAQAPNLSGADMSEFGRMLKVYAALPFGFPPHWMGEPGDSNRATASEMGTPTQKRLKGRQKRIRGCLCELLDFCIDQAIAAGQLDASYRTGHGGDRRFDLVLPTIWGNDAQQVANASVALTNSLAMAVDAGWLSDGEAGSVYRYQVAQLGVDLNDIDERTGERQGPDERQQVAVRRALDPEEQAAA